MKPFVYALFLWAAIAAIFLLVVDNLVMPYISGRFKETVVVLDYMGAAPERVSEQLKNHSLIPVIDSIGEFSPEIAAGLIVNQRPLANTRVKEGRRVWFTISKGLNSVKTPDLQGQSLRQAEISLQQVDLKLDSVVSISNSEFPAGMVIKTEPTAGTEVSVQSPVTLFVSQAKDQNQNLMTLVGLPINRAKKIILEANMKIGKIRYRKDSKTLPNTVLKQSPRPGSPIQKGLPVHLIISKR